MTRVLQGMGGAMLSPVGRLILLRSFPKEELARAMAYVAIPALIGPTVGPVLGGFITTYFNWRWIFYVNIPVGLIGIALALRYTEDFRATAPSRFDLRGFIIVGVGLATLQFGFENVGRHVLPPAAIVASFAAAAWRWACSAGTCAGIPIRCWTWGCSASGRFASARWRAGSAAPG